nr:cell number regulator 11-like [Aegilops tauschii subsp. strangulata]
MEITTKAGSSKIIYPLCSTHLCIILFPNIEGCLTCWCPCVTFGRIAEIADKGSTSCCMSGTLYVCLSLLCCHWLYSFPKRSAMLSQYNLQEWPFMDWYVHHYPSCALCQEYRELENRGFNMAKGL